MPGPPTSVHELRALLEKRGLRPKKSLGQNFLIAADVLQAIAQAADIQPDEVVVEVGPGVGTLTRWLALAARRVVAVEVDANMVAILRETLAAFENVTLIHADILKLDLDAALALSAPYKVVANLPYYITSAIIRKFLDRPHRPSVLVLMMQDEVARRILAAPGDMSLLAASVQFYARPSRVMRLPAGAFYPAPQVDSALIRLDVQSGPLAVSPERFFRVAQAGFGQRRKTLRNALASGLGIGREQSEALLTQAGIDPQRRAQTLAIAEWVRLAEAWDGPLADSR
ncbi:MAG: 16S rRNA (adenine(1518)-N(6)/adenine(1519)-N(6))-dimethyltransferase RsmA [Chloroflexi bacterium]|nr:16S rRNA (adenine(1518)-N(6)/adenine(1519)-N(6))-dimethyltransferase RsmA [Chloroflexota bacterium]